MIVLAVALVFNLPAILQRAVPDYTAAMQRSLGARTAGRSSASGTTSIRSGQMASWRIAPRAPRSCNSAGRPPP